MLYDNLLLSVAAKHVVSMTDKKVLLVLRFKAKVLEVSLSVTN